MLVSILENGRHLGFLIGPLGRIDLVTIEMPYANFGACITICTIHPKNACYLLHYYWSRKYGGLSKSSFAAAGFPLVKDAVTRDRLVES